MKKRLLCFAFACTLLSGCGAGPAAASPSDMQPLSSLAQIDMTAWS